MKEEQGRNSTAQSSRDRSRSEFDLINKLRQLTVPTEQSVVVRIGDDAAVISSEAGKDTVVLADGLDEVVDVRGATTTLAVVGDKSLGVLVSAIAAMGARPRSSLMSIGMPDDIGEAPLRGDFYRGFLSLAQLYDVQ